MLDLVGVTNCDIICVFIVMMFLEFISITLYFVILPHLHIFVFYIFLCHPIIIHVIHFVFTMYHPGPGGRSVLLY